MGLAYTQNTKVIYVNRAPHTNLTWFLRSFEWLPLYFGVYLTAASFVQAFLLASTQTTAKTRLSPRAWNHLILIIFIVTAGSQFVRPGFSIGQPHRRRG